MRIGAGRFRNALLPAAGPGVRPVPARARQSLFTLLLPRLEGARVLDLCAGVGGFGLEALSRGAASVVLVDDDPRTCAALRRWVEQRGLRDEATVVRADARRGGWPPRAYDLVFLDPPFEVWGGGGGRNDRGGPSAVREVPHGAGDTRTPAGAGRPVPSAPHPPAAEDARAFLASAVAATAPGGLVIVKLPARAALPDDPRWRILDRRAHGDVALALLARAAPP